MIYSPLLRGKIMLKNLLVLTLLALAACAPSREASVVGGKSNYSIINGVEVAKNDPIAKVTVGIINVLKDSKGEIEQAKCTGLIIAKNVILTAAHCVELAPKGGKRAAVIVFSTNMETATEADVRIVTDFVRHPLYKKPVAAGQSESDFGLLKFEGEIPAGFEIADLLTDKEHELLNLKSDIILAGYGLLDDATKKRTNILHKGHSKLIDAYGKKETVIDQRDRNGICSGDSGGPAFIEVDGKLKAWGIASRVSGETDETVCSSFGVHGIIAANWDFIGKTLKAFAK
jgi:V8-like Glu-specific endopeptidase